MVKDEDIFKAFRLCLRHKASSPSATKYWFGYEEDLLRLADEINARTYRPSVSTTFIVSRPRLREVFAANFRDRIVHHYVAMRLEPLFEEMFGGRTFNCRVGKGVLFGVNTLASDMKACSHGYTRDVWVVKFDLKGFFTSIDKRLLDRMLLRFIRERYKGSDSEDVAWLTHIIATHCPEKDCVRRSPSDMWDRLPPGKSLFTNGENKGLPIGNLSSQHFANFFLHGLDMLLERLGYEHHGRYVDDVYYMKECASESDRQKMLHDMGIIRRWLRFHLHVTVHPDKFYFQHYKKGVQFTGAVVKPGRVYTGSRTVSSVMGVIVGMNRHGAESPRILERYVQRANSYLGVLRHYNAYGIRRRLVSMISQDIWPRIYVKGHCDSIHIRSNRRNGMIYRYGDHTLTITEHNGTLVSEWTPAKTDSEKEINRIRKSVT